MYLKYVQIVNFKNLKNVRFEFAKGANTIIGENDSGKSNALTAIRILLDDNYYYNTKRLKETDFSYALGDWKGHWIIISAFFDEISNEDKYNEFCAELTPDRENIDFLKSYICCTDKDFGNNIKKGWYATLLAEMIDASAVIPLYILEAIVFAAKDILSEKLLWKMAQYSFEQYDLDSDFDDLKVAFKEAKSSKEIQETIKKFCDEFPNDMVSLFITKAGGLNV